MAHSKDILPIVLHQNVAVPHIIAILRGDDMIWIYWLIELVIPYLMHSNKELVKGELERLSSLDVTDEDVEEVVRAAKNCLEFYYT